MFDMAGGGSNLVGASSLWENKGPAGAPAQSLGVCLSSETPTCLCQPRTISCSPDINSLGRISKAA